MTDSDPTRSTPPGEEPAQQRQQPGTSHPTEDPGYLTETGEAAGEDGSVAAIIGGLPAVEGSAWDIGAPLNERGADLAGEQSGRPGQAGQQGPRVVSASREIAASAERIFGLIADPAQQPRWDGNGNLAWAAAGQRVHSSGEVFTMTLTVDGSVRENHVVEFEEGRRIAWMPAEPGQQRPGHLWRWELTPADPSHTRVTCTYDWSRLTDENRFARARSTTPDRLRASLDRLAALAEGS